MPATVSEIDDDLKKLEYLSLVSKVYTELENHVGCRCSDKVLVEFITELGRDAVTVEEFDATLKENGAEMPSYFVRTILTIIHAILPPKSKSKPSPEASSKKKSAAYPGLSNDDDRQRIKELEREIEKEIQDKQNDERKYRGHDSVRDRNHDFHYDPDRNRDRRGHRDCDRDRRYNQDIDRNKDRDAHDVGDGDRDKDMGRSNARDGYRSSHMAYTDDEDDNDRRHGRTHFSGKNLFIRERYCA